MALGLSAAAWGAIGAIGAPIVGGIMGGESSSQGTTTTQKQEIDPRIAQYLYGGSGGGLLGGINSLYQQQMSQGGLNPMQQSGLEMQRQTLMDPRYAQGYSQMRDVGMGLLGGGVAGNPFTGGGGIPPMQMPSSGVPSGGAPPGLPGGPAASGNRMYAHGVPAADPATGAPTTYPAAQGNPLEAANTPIQQQIALFLQQMQQRSAANTAPVSAPMMDNGYGGYGGGGGMGPGMGYGGGSRWDGGTNPYEFSS